MGRSPSVRQMLKRSLRTLISGSGACASNSGYRNAGNSILKVGERY